MNPHALLAAAFAAAFAAALLLGPFGCSKKDDSGPAPAANTGNYASDGRLVSCTATVDRHTNAGTDFLTVELATTPPTAGNEIAQRLNISKLTLYKYLRHRQVV